MTDVDVVVVGAGPAGLMLAGELRLAGVRALVLERYPEQRKTPKAGGLGGQVLDLLRYRGILDRLAAACGPEPAPRFPFGGVHLDLTGLADPPMRSLPLGQAELERVLEDRAGELGAEIRRGHEVVGLDHDDDTVTVEVRGPDGAYSATARYLVGCDGARSRIRDLAGIAFPGTTYPEVHRYVRVTLPDSLTRLDNDDLEVPGVGRIRAGEFVRTGRGVFGYGAGPDSLFLYTNEDETADYDDDVPMTLDEFGASVRRVLGADLPMGEPLRLSRFTFQARQAERYRTGRILLAGDAAHLFPATGVAINAGMLDTVNLAWKLAAVVDGWAPAGLLDTYHDERHLAGRRTLLHTQAQVALRRGQDAAADALRDVFTELLADEQTARRLGSLLAAADIRYPMPGSDRHPLVGTFVPDLKLDLANGRPVLLDLAGRGDLRTAAEGWRHRVDVRTVDASLSADAVLIRPDGYIAWAAPAGEPADTAVAGLHEALSAWFGVRNGGSGPVRGGRVRPARRRG